MTLKEKFNIRKSRWQEYRRCRKNKNKIWQECHDAESKIFISVTFYHNMTEYDWPSDAPCKRKLFNDFNGPVDSDNPPFVGNIFEYPSYCKNFPSCHKTDCPHYANYLRYIDASGKLRLAQKELYKARKELFAKIK